MGKILIPVLTTAAVVAAMFYQSREIDPVLCAAPDVRLPEIAGFTSETCQATEVERDVLPSDTKILKSVYRSEMGNFSAQVTMVVGGRSKSSVHRPELCLPAQGFQMSNPQTVSAGGVEWHLVRLVRRDAPPMGFAYTFFNQDGFRTSSHLKRIFRDVWDRSVLGRIDRWVMVTVCASSDNETTLSAFLGCLKEVVK